MSIELAAELERAIEAFHDALPGGQGETGDHGKAGRALCQLFYDNSDTIIAALRQSGGWREEELEKVVLSALARAKAQWTMGTTPGADFDTMAEIYERLPSNQYTANEIAAAIRARPDPGESVGG